ncbi:unnamed protein product [Ectocarpus sp. 6 AP-2014]
MGVGLERNDGRQQQYHDLQQYQQREPRRKPQGQPMQHRHHSPWHPEFEQQDIRAVVRSGSNSKRTCIDDYETARPIGKGKFAIVYRAKRKKDGKTVALKRVSMSDMGEKFRTKCMREVHLLQSLDHGNIIRYQDSFLDNNELVIVLEWAAAGDLKRQVRKALERAVHFEERIIWGYFSQICGAISYMHRMQIMHRDIKPANIFLTLKGQVKVGDLGLGRVMNADDELAYSKVGTPLYMSVEVLGGGGYSWKSDVWSLGCVLYELAMLRSPFKSESLSLYSLYKKISSGDYPPMLAYYSEELRALATGMINTNPDERPSVHEAHSIALAMKRKMAGKGNPATLPPQIARHLKPKNPAPRKIAAATPATSVTTAAGKLPPSRRAATSGDEYRGGMDPRRNGPAGFALDSGTPALAEGAAAVPPSVGHIGAVVEATSSTIRTRTRSHDLRPEQTGEAATAGALAHRLGGYSNNGEDDGLCHHQQQHHHHHHHHHHHRRQNNRHHSCHHDKMEGKGSSHTRRERNERVVRNEWKHQHENLKQQQQQQQQQEQQRHAMCEPRLSGNNVDHGVGSGNRDNKSTIVEAAVPTQADGAEGGTTTASVTIGNEERKRANGTATSILTSTSAMHARADATKNRHQHNPEQHPVVLAAPWFEIAQTATPQPLPVGAVVTASGIVLPRVRAGSLAAKVKAAKAAAATAAARESEGARGSSARRSPSPLPPRASTVPAAPSVTAGDGARGSTLPAVVVGRRARATSANKSKSNSGTTATSSPSSSSTPSSRGRGEELRHESNSSSSGGTRSGSGGDGGAIERARKGGGGGGGGGGNRHDDVEMMMAAENNDDRDDKECGNRRRTQERQERRKKKSDHNNKRGTTHNSEAGNDSSRSKSVSSLSVPSSPCLRPGESAACVDAEKEKDVQEAKETETTTAGAAAPSGRKSREGKQRRRRHGRSAGPAVNANAAATFADNAATTAVEAAAAAAAAAATAPAASATPERGWEAVAASAARSVPVSGENLVAMEALSDRLSILGYDKDLRTRNMPPLSRLHFAVPGADSGGGCDDDGERGGDRPLFPSCQEHFLDFVALSKWLLEQLGGGGGGYAGFESAATDAPVAVCTDILQACQRLGFEPSKPEEEVGEAVGTGSPSPSAASPAAATVSPTNLAVGSGTAVLELLGWLSHAVLVKVKTTLSRGLGNREDEGKWGQEAKRLTDYSDERGTQDEEDGVVVRRPGKGRVGATKGKSGETTIAGRATGGDRAEAGSIGRHGRSDSASSNNSTAAGRRRDRVIHLSKKARAADGEGDERTIEMASVAAPAAGARGNNNSGSGAGDNGRRRFTLLPELASMMATTAVVSSSGGYTSCWCSCSCSSSRCSCYTSQFGSSTDDGHGGGGGGGGSGDLEDGEAVSCPWGKDSSTDGLAFMGSMIDPTVDPAEWRAEQERVAPRLARAAPPAGSLEVGKNSWASRVEVFSKAAAVISSATAGGDSPPQAVAAAPRSATPGGQGNGYGDGYSSIGGKRESKGQTSRAMTTAFAPDINASKDRKDCLESMLVRHRGEVLQQLMAMTAGEQRVNNLHGGGSTGGGGGSGNLPCFRQEALPLRDQERALLEELEERKARVAALTIELRDAEAAVDETEVEVREAAADCSDPTKLFKTKSAIRQLKADVKAMDVLIGAKSATFLGKQQGVQRAAREAEHSAPVGSRWGGLNSRAGGGEGGGGGGGARTALSTPSPSVSPALVADSSSTEATTNTASTPSSGSSRGGSGGVGVGGVVGLLGKQKAPEVGDGAGGPRRGGVLIQAAMRLLATGQSNATATATEGGAEAEAEAQAQAWAEAGAGGNNQDHQMLARHNCINGDDWLDEKERE